MVIQSQPRKFRLGINRAHFDWRQTVVKLAQYRDQPRHDHRIACAVKMQLAAVKLCMKPDLRGAAVDLGRRHAQRLGQRVHRFTKVDHMAVAVFPIVQKLEILDQFFKSRRGHLCTLSG